MRLVLYQKLLRASPQEIRQLLFQQLERGQRGGCWNHGFDLSLRQLQAACESYGSFTAAAAAATATAAENSTDNATRLVVRLNPSSADDVARQFDFLDALLQTKPLLFGSLPIDVDLVVVRRPPGLDASSGIIIIIDYLYQVLPYGAMFLEAYPSVGSFEKHGQRNAHGNPMDRHVIGVCHDLNNSPLSVHPSSSSSSPSSKDAYFLAEVVDVLPPTRLSTSIMAATSCSSETNSIIFREEGNDDGDLGWEAVQQSTDHIDFQDDDSFGKNDDAISQSFCARVWKWQREVATARETYVSCSSERAAQNIRNLYNSIMLHEE
jgi:hypothetical protein